MGELRQWTGGAIDVTRAFKSIERAVVRPIGGALESGLSSITKTLDNVLRDPLPTLMQIGGAMIGIPPYVTAAAITAVKGGDLEDIAKSAAISYATTYVMQGTQFGQDIQNYTSNQLSGDFTDFLIENFNISTDAAVMTANIARQSLNSAVVGGINAAITGKDIDKAITSGFTQGLVYSSTGSFFDDVNKNQNWGLSDKTLNLLKGATSSALNAAISGKGDPAAAVGNYVANAFFNQGKNKLTLELKKSYDNFTATQTGMENAWDEYNAVKNTYDQHVAQYNKLSSDIQSISNTYNSIYDNQYVGFANQLSSISSQYQQQVNLFQSAQNDYNNNKWAYENYDAYLTQNGYVPQFTAMGEYSAYIGTFKELPDGTWVFPPSSDSLLTEANAAADRANAAVAQADALANQHKTVSANASQVVDTLKYYETLAANTSNTANSLKQYIEGDLTNAIKSHETKLNEAYDDFVETEQQVTQLADEYNRQLVEIATRDATIDAVKQGLIPVVGKENGEYKLANGMTLSNGKFYRDGQQLFSDIDDIPYELFDESILDTSIPETQETIPEQPIVEAPVVPEVDEVTETSPLDVLGEPLTPEAETVQPTIPEEVVEQPPALDVLGQPLTPEASVVEPTLPPQEEPVPVVGPSTEDRIRRMNEEFAKFLDYQQAGEPPPPDYGVQDLGISEENWNSFNQNLLQMQEEGRLPTQWKPNQDGTFTFTGDDGDTITINPDGSIVGYTEAPMGNLPGETVPSAPSTSGQVSLTSPFKGFSNLRTRVRQPSLVNQAFGGTSLFGGLTGTSPTVEESEVQKPTTPPAVYNKLDKFEGPLDQFLAMVQEGSYVPKTESTPTSVMPTTDRLDQPQTAQVDMANYFNYGLQPSIDSILSSMSNLSNAGSNVYGMKAGGMASPLMAAHGGALDVIHHAGKARLDFRKGAAVSGPGDGQSDDIPAMLADGEFVFPADVVAALGNGSTKAGSDKLYEMMHEIRAYHRSAKPKDLPPPAKKSPLDYLKKSKG